MIASDWYARVTRMASTLGHGQGKDDPRKHDEEQVEGNAHFRVPLMPIDVGVSPSLPLVCLTASALSFLSFVGGEILSFASHLSL